MTNIFQSLLLVIANATQSELARQIKFLKVENEILRKRCPRIIPLTPKEKQRLIRFGRKLGTALRELCTVVHQKTFLRWLRQERKGYVPRKILGRKTPEQIQKIILKLARENQWGYTRILGELKKLGVRKISRNTVKRILKDAGLDPGPKRGEGTWDDFLKQHAASLWQCDFFSKRILTMRGIREAFVLVFLNVKTRRVIVMPATYYPDKAWIAEQVEPFVNEARGQDLPITIVQRDRDKKYTDTFDALLKSARVKVKVGTYRSPNTNAYVERFVQTIKQDCLDRFVIFGTEHMDHVCREFVEHYHEERPHQALDNEPIIKPKKRGRHKKIRNEQDQTLSLTDVRCKQRLGGLLKSYSRRAA